MSTEFKAIAPFTCKIDPRTITILDDFLEQPIPEEEIDRIDRMRDKNVAGRYNWVRKEDISLVSLSLHRLYSRTVEILGLNEDELVGIEFWVNTFGPGDGIHMHSDLDETLYRKTRRMECAVAGAMFFAQTRDLKGGSFIFEDGIIIRPRNNRAVMFFGGTRHGVEPVVEGERRSVLMAFWHRIPTAYEEHPAGIIEETPTRSR